MSDEHPPADAPGDHEVAVRLRAIEERLSTDGDAAVVARDRLIDTLVALAPAIPHLAELKQLKAEQLKADKERAAAAKMAARTEAATASDKRATWTWLRAKADDTDWKTVGIVALGMIGIWMPDGTAAKLLAVITGAG